MDDEANVKTGIFCVSEEQWSEFTQMMDDSGDNFQTWASWKIALEKTKGDLRDEGIEAVEVPVDLNEFRSWCADKNLALNGEARANYAAELLQKQST